VACVVLFFLAAIGGFTLIAAVALAYLAYHLWWSRNDIWAWYQARRRRLQRAQNSRLSSSSSNRRTGKASRQRGGKKAALNSSSSSSSVQRQQSGTPEGAGHTSLEAAAESVGSSMQLDTDSEDADGSIGDLLALLPAGKSSEPSLPKRNTTTAFKAAETALKAGNTVVALASSKAVTVAPGTASKVHVGRPAAVAAVAVPAQADCTEAAAVGAGKSAPRSSKGAGEPFRSGDKYLELAGCV
jgi:hypothetical protein